MTCTTCPRGRCDECGKCRRGWTDIGFGGNPPAECSYCGCPGCDCPMSVAEPVEKKAPAAPMPIADQLATIAPYLGQAAEQILPEDTDHERIVRLAITRFASIGAAEHGDALFHRSPEELIDEEDAEFADAIVYRARRLSLTTPKRVVVGRLDITPRVDQGPMRSALQAMREEFSRQLMHEIVHGSRPAGYDEGNSAEALHPPQGDA